MAAAIMGGCSGQVTGPGHTPNYRVEGILVLSLATNTARMDLTLTKDSVNFKKAIVTLGSTVLDTNVLGYTKEFAAGVIETTQNYQLNIHDSTSLNVDLMISIPGGLRDSVVSPVSKIYRGETVHVVWTISTGTDGYILATQPPPGAISDSVFSAYFNDTQGSIIPDPFRINDMAVSGKHTIFVAAFTGAPTQLPAVPFLIPVANNPADNVSKKILFGRLAGMVVAVPDSIIVP